MVLSQEWYLSYLSLTSPWHGCTWCVCYQIMYHSNRISWRYMTIYVNQTNAFCAFFSLHSLSFTHANFYSKWQLNYKIVISSLNKLFKVINARFSLMTHNFPRCPWERELTSLTQRQSTLPWKSHFLSHWVWNSLHGSLCHSASQSRVQNTGCGKNRFNRFIVVSTRNRVYSCIVIYSLLLFIFLFR